MKKYLSIVLLLFCTQNVFPQLRIGKERLDKTKKSVVQVVIDGQVSGTGFFVSTYQIATCYHVVFGNLTNRTIPSSIKIIRDDSILLSVVIPKYYHNELNSRASLYDYCLLEIANPKEIQKEQSFLKLGNFKDVNEGDWVLSCGYPQNIPNAFVSVGLFSTKWKRLTAYELRGNDTIALLEDCGWLDITMNKGNSGGPIILLGQTRKEDLVIGIASFIISPFSNEAEDLRKFIKTLGRTGSYYNGVNQMDMNVLFSNAIENNSIGISGCVAIDHFKLTVPIF